MKAILFDFDGTIINSQPIIDEFVKKRLEEKQIKLNNEEEKNIKGMSLKDLTVWITKNKKTEIKKDYLKINSDIEENIGLIKDARKTLAKIKSLGYKTAIVTNSPKDYVNRLIKKHDLEHFFDFIITEDDAKPKPNPEMLRIAAKKLIVKPDECAIIDDSKPGIIAGNELGMTTIKLGKKINDAKYGVDTIAQLPNLLEQIQFTHQ